MLIVVPCQWMDAFFARMVIPFSFSRSIESIARSVVASFSR